LFGAIVQILLALGLAFVEIIHIHLIAEIGQHEIEDYRDSRDPDDEFQ
jgi:hypothetical protein